MEIGIGTLIWFSPWRRAAAIISAVLALAFLIHLTLVATSGIKQCGCMLVGGDLLWVNWAIDIVLLAVSLVLITKRWNNERI